MKAIPNILSIFRICLVPVFIAAFMLDDSDFKFWAIVIFVVANFSDVIDGIIARKWGAESKLGKVLDPLGDKLIIFSALVCITIEYWQTGSNPLLAFLVGFYFFKEILMAIGGLLIVKKARVELPSSNWLGKATTVFFFIVCVSLMIFHDMPPVIATTLMGAAIILSVTALARYLYTYISIMKNRKPQQSARQEE